jgi:signal transduction histidine kinase/DNA-binding NarL/FixJ family response regulator/HPt (histidine-containing phosphotransfer) domain-containing protein
MSHIDPSLIKVADRDLAKEATLSSILFLLGWLIVIYTTDVPGDLPYTSMTGIVLFMLLVATRLYLGLGFDRLYERMSPRHWQHAFGAVVLFNGLTWGSLCAIVVWHYFPAWPAYLALFCTAGFASGGTNSINTHLRLLRGFLTLAVVPSVIVLLSLDVENSQVFGILLAVYFLFLMAFSRQLNARYWAALQNSHLLEEQVVMLQEARDKAEVASRAKSQFLANISHEIRTPLNAVLGFAQVGRRTSQDADARNRFSQILASGQHLLRIIDEVLDLSKLDAGKLRVHSIPFELTATVDETLDLVRESAGEKGLELAVEYAPGLPDWVLGDSLRLRQILTNLLDNAVKFTREGNVRLVVKPVNGQISFSVIDTGIGIDNAQISRLFHAFEQADGTTTRRFGGAGLGLAISLHLAELMGGSITAAGAPGKGSTFTLVLPLPETRQREYHAGTEARPAAARLAGLNVLAVEDDALNRMVLREMLENEGATLVLAENGQQAMGYLERADPVPFDMVIMDVQMPEMDGYEATRRIHAIAPGLPVIGLTAHAMQEARDQCLAAGMVAHVTKPVDVNDLVDVLLQWLSGGGEKHVRAAMTQPAPAIENSRQDMLPGFAVDSALANLQCDLPVFRKILLTFYLQRRDNCDEIAALLARGEIEEARELLHGIAGSSGYLGALTLYQEARLMEEACKTGDLDVVIGHLPSFRRSFEEVMGGLAALQAREDAGRS